LLKNELRSVLALRDLDADLMVCSL